MKTIALFTDWAVNDIEKYGKDLLDRLKTQYDFVLYNSATENFSNVKELFDEEPKVLLFNPYILERGFEKLTFHLHKFKNIKYILSPYVRYEGFDTKRAKELNIQFINNPGTNSASVAQFAITLMFMLLTRYPQLSRYESLPTDGPILGEEYKNKKAGLIGAGYVGIEINKSVE